MPHDSFDFTFVQRAWSWSHRVGDAVVARSSRAFATLNECIADARKAGFHSDVATGAIPADGDLVGSPPARHAPGYAHAGHD